MKTEQHNRQQSDLPAGLSAPAQRALAGAGVTNLEHLSRMSEKELKRLHGIGPNAIRQLRLAMEARGLSFAGEKKGATRDGK